MDSAQILAYVTGTVDQELLARNEYLAAKNLILRAQLKGRLKLSDAERATLGEIGHRLGRKVLGEVATVARPDTILAWYRKRGFRSSDRAKGRAAGTAARPRAFTLRRSRWQGDAMTREFTMNEVTCELLPLPHF